MRSITRAAALFCCPPQRTAGGTIAARPSTGTGTDLPPTATRCPTCDREGCRVEAERRRISGRPCDEQYFAACRDCRAHRVDWRARALAAEADAVRWRTVAPLIEALHQASMIEAGDPMHVVDAAMELLAATQEPTP